MTISGFYSNLKSQFFEDSNPVPQLEQISSIKKTVQDMPAFYQKYAGMWDHEIHVTQGVLQGSGKTTPFVKKVASYVAGFFRSNRNTMKKQENGWTKGSRASFFRALQKTQLLAFASLFFAFIKTGVDIKEAAQNKKVFKATTNLVGDLGALMVNASYAISALNTLDLVSADVARAAAIPLGIGSLLSSVSIIVSGKTLYQRIKFQKQMKQEDDFQKFIKAYDAKKLARHLGAKDGEAVQQSVKTAFETENKARQEEVMKTLKGRITKNNWSDALSMLIDTVSLVALGLILFCPPLALIGYGLSAGFGVAMIAKAIYDYVDSKKLNQTLGIEQKIKTPLGDYRGTVKDGMPHGKGSCCFHDGRFYEGEWKEGKFHGSGQYTYKNGSVLNIHFNEGQPDGEGAYCLKNGRKFTHVWENGVIRSLQEA